VGATATPLLAKKKRKKKHNPQNCWKLILDQSNERIEINKTQNCWKSILDQ
jgi:hypothetical protein